jgi:rhodanese-related sulfurtransferase
MTTLQAGTKTATPRPRPIDPRTARQLMDQKQAVLIDVREPDEHARESIPGAVLMPLSKFDPAAVGRLEGAAAAAAAAATGGAIVLHCRSGNRSAQAAQRMLAAGWEQVHDLTGGIEAWKKAGLPVNLKPGVPIMQQVQIAAGSLVLVGVILGALVSPWFLILSGFVGAGLVFAGSTGHCGMAMLLQKMPWNRG